MRRGIDVKGLPIFLLAGQLAAVDPRLFQTVAIHRITPLHPRPLSHPQKKRGAPPPSCSEKTCRPTSVKARRHPAWGTLFLVKAVREFRDDLVGRVRALSLVLSSVLVVVAAGFWFVQLV